MNKEQFGYKLGSLYLKLPVLAKQKAAQYNLPVPLVYVLAYTPVAVLALFSIMLFAAITAILIVLIFLACLVNQERDEFSNYDEGGNNEEVEHIAYRHEDKSLNNEYEIYYD